MEKINQRADNFISGSLEGLLKSNLLVGIGLKKIGLPVYSIGETIDKKEFDFMENFNYDSNSYKAGSLFGFGFGLLLNFATYGIPNGIGAVADTAVNGVKYKYDRDERI